MQNPYFIHQETKITKHHKNLLNRHNSFVVWLTGLSGAGKSTIAEHLEALLYTQGCHTHILDGDKVRQGLCNDLGFTLEDRKENIRRVAETANILVNSGIIVISAFISPIAHEREMAKTICWPNDFIEVFVQCPLEECEKRDIKGLYKKARNGEIKNFTGLDSPYEIPKKPDITINTESFSIRKCVNAIYRQIVDRYTLPLSLL